jgi:hypothetical protein
MVAREINSLVFGMICTYQLFLPSIIPCLKLYFVFQILLSILLIILIYNRMPNMFSCRIFEIAIRLHTTFTEGGESNFAWFFVFLPTQGILLRRSSNRRGSFLQTYVNKPLLYLGIEYSNKDGISAWISPVDKFLDASKGFARLSHERGIPAIIVHDWNDRQSFYLP